MGKYVLVFFKTRDIGQNNNNKHLAHTQYSCYFDVNQHLKWTKEVKNWCLVYILIFAVYLYVTVSNPVDD